MPCWDEINKAMDTVTKDFVPTTFVEVLVVAEDAYTLDELKKRVTSHMNPTAVRFNYQTVSRLTANTVRGRTRLMVLKETGVNIPPDIHRSLINSLISASQSCVDMAPEDLIFTV